MLFDQAVSYEPDTTVVDPIDHKTDEEPTMHVRLDDGLWHRKIVGVAGLVTACGVSIVSRHGHQMRSESYDGRLCHDGCFSAYELNLSTYANKGETK